MNESENSLLIKCQKIKRHLVRSYQLCLNGELFTYLFYSEIVKILQLKNFLGPYFLGGFVVVIPY